MALLITRITSGLGPKSLQLKTQIAPIQAAFISGRAFRDRTYPKPPPFPYKEKQLSILRAWFQNPLKWFDENTKLVVVEGNIGSGKTDFAKKLATELEMLHMPEVTLDSMYINPYGYDYRQLDPKLADEVKSFDIKDYYKNPKSKLANKFQIYMYYMRHSQYIDALAHIFNTGQGVVLERCVYSDVVFMETMAKFNYLAPRVRDFYYEIRRNSLPALMRPHLVIYLDSPVEVLMDRIKQRGVDYEVKSSVITPDYLKTLETEYKEYLKDISQHAELLFYDWSNFGDIEIVIEDIEQIDFDKYDKYDQKLSDWRLFDYWDFVRKRYEYTTLKSRLQNGLEMIPMWHVPELCPIDMENVHKFHLLLDETPGNKFAPGYNPDMGDSVLFKLKKQPRSL